MECQDRSFWAKGDGIGADSNPGSVPCVSRWGSEIVKAYASSCASTAGSSSCDDAELIRRIAGKDRQAFEDLYREYYRRVFRFLLRMTGRAELSEELVSDVMFVVWQSAANFKGRSTVSTWILGIAYRKALKALRRMTRVAEVEWPSETDSLSSDTTESDLGRAELRDSIDVALRQVSSEHRMVVEMTYYFGYSYREIAEIAGCPVNTVKTRMFHARRRLRELLSHMNPSSGGSPQREW